MTYTKIQKYVREKHGFAVKSCWIAHAKELCGLPLRKAWNRGKQRKYPCPDEKFKNIKEAFIFFGLLNK